MPSLPRRLYRWLRRKLAGDPTPRLHAAIARTYLHGDGIEIGALHNPLRLPSRARVRYIDRLTVAELRQHYPELRRQRLVEPDILDNGERLAHFADASQDFVIANHFLEHCQDPIGCLKQIFRVLRAGGVLYLSLPDKRFTFDRSRAVTPLEHLWSDHRHGPEGSRRAHFEDYVRAVHDCHGLEEGQAQVDKYLSQDFSIHFHVWTQKEMLELLLALREELGFDFELMRKNGHEVIFVLRKHE